MTHNIGIYYNEDALRDIMKGNKIQGIEQEIMINTLDRIKAEFLQTFGFAGSFEIKKVDTQSRRSRTTFRIVATDKRTGAALKAHPGWLSKRFL